MVMNSFKQNAVQLARSCFKKIYWMWYLMKDYIGNEQLQADFHSIIEITAK